MPGLKDKANASLSKLINIDRFGEVLVVEGRQIMVALNEVPSEPDSSGVFLNRLDLYANRASLHFTPVPESSITISGARWRVKTVSPPTEFITKIELYQYAS